MKASAWLITVASAIQIFGFLYSLPGHLDEPTWSAHAQFHHVLGFIWIASLDITVMVLVWRPFQKKEKWSFWILLVSLIFAHGGYFFSSFGVPAGRPSEPWYDWAIGGVLLLYAAGLAIGWRALNAPVKATT